MRERAALWVVVAFVLFAIVVVGGGGWYLVNQMGIVDLRGGPDMESTMSVSPATVAAGGSVTYTANYANIGESPAGAVTVIVTLPEGVTVGEFVPSGACTASGATVTCRLGTQNSGKSGSVTVTGTVGSSVAKGTSLEAQARITTGTTRDVSKAETIMDNNTASAAVTVN